jgi:hypothetical protein
MNQSWLAATASNFGKIFTLPPTTTEIQKQPNRYNQVIIRNAFRHLFSTCLSTVEKEEDDF